MGKKDKKKNKFDIIFLFRDIFFFGWINMVIIENLYNKVNNLLKKIYFKLIKYKKLYVIIRNF